MKTDIFLRGLKSKSDSPSIVLDWNQVKNYFDIGEPQPIFVEYTFLKKFDTEHIKWSEQSIIPGEYRLVEVGCEIADRKANGRNWDFGGAPDPVLSMYVNGGFVLNDGPSKDSFEPKFRPNRVIKIIKDMILQFDFYDNDLMSEHDQIGKAQLQYDKIVTASLNKPIELVVTGQVKRAWMIIAPIS